jgi:hypothetical protein
MGGVTIAAPQIAPGKPDEESRETRQGSFSQKAGKGFADSEVHK